MDRLEIFLGTRKVGELTTDDQGRLQFAYAGPEPLPLSLGLPVRLVPYTDEECRPFFAGLLPEGEALRHAAANKRLQPYETFRLLEAYGGECAGAVRLLPPGAAPTIAADYELMDEADLAQLAHRLPTDPNFSSDGRVRLSLAGAQAKTAVAIFDDGIFRPLGGSPSTHIVKIAANSDYVDIVRNEAFCMRLADRMGLDVAPVELRSFGGIPCLLVTRYDRVMGAHRHVAEWHQEDMGQALRYPPERKYQFDDQGAQIGPALPDCLALLKSVRAPALAEQEFRRRVLFNFLIGNADAHAKNSSLLYDEPGRAPVLAPAYDLVCTRIYPTLTEDFALAIGAARRADALTLADLESLAPATAAGRRAFLKEADNMASTIVPAARALCREYPFSEQLPFGHILSCIGQRAMQLGEILGKPVTVDTRPFILRGGGWLQES